MNGYILKYVIHIKLVTKSIYVNENGNMVNNECISYRR